MASAFRSSLPLLLFFFLFYLSTISIDAAHNHYICESCITDPMYTHDNMIHSLVNLIASNTSTVDFATVTAGSGNNTAYGLVQCRGDLSPTDCRSCIRDITNIMTDHCPNATSGTMWFDKCLLNLDYWNFFGIQDSSIMQCYTNSLPLTDEATLQRLLTTLLSNLTTLATENTHIGHFASGSVPLNVSHNIYAVVQCTADLSAMNCSVCLNHLISQVSIVVSSQRNWMYSRSCGFMYDYSLFYDLPSAPYPLPGNGTTLPPHSVESDGDETNKRTAIIVFDMLVLFISFVWST